MKSILTKNKEALLDARLLRKLLNYNPCTGKFVWLERPVEYFKTQAMQETWNNQNAGRVAGTFYKTTGYVIITILYQRYLAHRLAWLYVKGEWPISQIDHENHDRKDNRFVNLKESTQQENTKNSSLCKDNKSGCSGVMWVKKHKVWQVTISDNKKRIYLGRTKDYFEAVCLRKAAEVKYGYHKNHGSRIIYENARSP